jgi:hypothetical protein
MNIKTFFATLVAAGLTACGGGGGDPGGTNSATGGQNPTTPTYVLNLELSSSTVSLGKPIEVKATLQSSRGVAVAGAVVSFSTTLSQGVFIPAAATALTDASGVAQIQLVPANASASGADTLVAAATVSGVSVTVSRGFQLTATNLTIDSLAADVQTIAAYGQTGVTVTLSAAAQNTPVAVSLTTNCGAKATVEPAVATTTTARATFTVIDKGCGAERSSILLNASVSGAGAARSLSVGVGAPSASSLKFLDASPSAIFLRGAGFEEVATVSFSVLDQAANPLPNQTVEMELTTYVGGLTLNDRNSLIRLLSDANGKVSARVNSGTVPTPVRVRATLIRADGTSGGSSVSSNLTVGVGLPSQRNFSLSQTACNIEGGNIDGTTNGYLILAADRSGNPVPNGTAISFIAEGGQIQANRTTALNAAGIAAATANFVTQEPRPVSDSRVTITAYAVGEESFLDVNGNNVWDAGEPFQDLGDVYRDANFNGKFDGGEETVPFGGSAACAAVSDPLLAIDRSTGENKAGTCDGRWGRAFVRRSIETVLSGSFGTPLLVGSPSGIAGSGTVGPLSYPASVGSPGLIQSSFLSLSGSQIILALTAAQQASCQSIFNGFRPTAGNVLLPNTTQQSREGVTVVYTPAPLAAADPSAPTLEEILNQWRNSQRTCTVSDATIVSIPFLLHDNHPRRLNPMAAGTKLSATASDGLTARVQPDAVGNTCEASGHSVVIAVNKSGLVTLEFTSPSGSKSGSTFSIDRQSFTPTAQ